jgi:hypothetical protein
MKNRTARMRMQIFALDFCGSYCNVTQGVQSDDALNGQRTARSVGTRRMAASQ